MNKITALIALFFIQIHAMAFGLSGRWQGQGELKINGSPQTEPCQMVMEIEHTATTFCVLKSEFKCPGMNIVNKKQTVLQIINGQLYSGEQKLGEITDTTMLSDYLMPDGRRQYYFMDLINPKTLLYKDRVDWMKGYTTEIVGTLN